MQSAAAVAVAATSLGAAATTLFAKPGDWNPIYKDLTTTHCAAAGAAAAAAGAAVRAADAARAAYGCYTAESQFSEQFGPKHDNTGRDAHSL